MGTIRKTIVLDRTVWEGFRDYVLAKYGSVRMLSTGVSDALKAFDSISLLWTLSDRLKLRIARYPSSDEIKSSRPKVSVSAGKTVRQMRDARLAHVSRLK